MKEHPTKETPENLDDCLEFMSLIHENFEDDDKIWFESALCEEEDVFIGRMHHELGLHIRNTWNMWIETSTLHKWFNSDLGIHHPDDMSGIVLRSYYRYKIKEPIELEKQVQEYKDYWAENKDE